MAAAGWAGLGHGVADGSSWAERSELSGRRGAVRLLLRIQRDGPTAQPGQGERFGIRSEPVLGSEHPKP